MLDLEQITEENSALNQMAKAEGERGAQGPGSGKKARERQQSGGGR
jgi:hypothetical protein